MDNLARIATPVSKPAARETFELFLIHEARLLDERRFREWMSLFTEDGTYWVPASDKQQSPFNHTSLFYDDLALMKTRIDRLEHPRIHVQTPPSRTLHLIGNLLIEETDEAKGETLTSSSVIMSEFRDDTQRLFSGRQYHRLRNTEHGLRIVQKRVNLINCDAAFEALAVPI